MSGSGSPCTETADKVLMPEKPDAEMFQAMENYFATRQKYRKRPNCDALKADCWMALQAYYAMVAVVKARTP